MNIGVYKIKNNKNNKVYIGSSKDLKRRWLEHKSKLRNSKHHSKTLQKDWDKYGENSFDFIVIEFVKNVDILINREQYYLDEYKSYLEDYGYNIFPCANSARGHEMNEKSKQNISTANKGEQNGMYGKIAANAAFTENQVIEVKTLIMQGVSPLVIAEKYNVQSRVIRNIERGKSYKNIKVDGFKPRTDNYKFTEDHKRNISKARTGSVLPPEKKGKNHPNFGKKLSEETRRKISEAGMGRIFTEKTRKKLSVANKGKVVSEETRRKISEKNKGKLSGEKAHTARLTDKEVIEIKELFRKSVSITEIAKKYNVAISTISSIKRGTTWQHIK